LDGLEQELQKPFPNPKTGSNAQVNLGRYCDDFLMTGRSQAVLEQEVKPLGEHCLAERGRRLAQEKTRITHSEEGFDFLGQHVRTYTSKLRIKPSQKSVKALVQKVREVLKVNKSTAAGQLIGQLTPRLRGWTNSHRHVVSKVTFAKMDHALFQALGRWAKRRHPHKPPGWRRRKSCTAVANPPWVFYGSPTSQGKTQEHRLMRLAYTPIKRHGKVKAEAHPYAPGWAPYFEARLGVKMAETLRGRRTLR
jgi:RNA-directed DNA polymerase